MITKIRTRQAQSIGHIMRKKVRTRSKNWKIDVERSRGVERVQQSWGEQPTIIQFGGP